jgi:hypothetical protein
MIERFGQRAYCFARQKQSLAYFKLFREGHSLQKEKVEGFCVAKAVLNASNMLGLDEKAQVHSILLFLR